MIISLPPLTLSTSSTHYYIFFTIFLSPQQCT